MGTSWGTLTGMWLVLDRVPAGCLPVPCLVALMWPRCEMWFRIGQERSSCMFLAERIVPGKGVLALLDHFQLKGNNRTYLDNTHTQQWKYNIPYQTVSHQVCLYSGCAAVWSFSHHINKLSLCLIQEQGWFFSRGTSSKCGINGKTCLRRRSAWVHILQNGYGAKISIDSG